MYTYIYTCTSVQRYSPWHITHVDWSLGLSVLGLSFSTFDLGLNKPQHIGSLLLPSKCTSNWWSTRCTVHVCVLQTQRFEKIKRDPAGDWTQDLLNTSHMKFVELVPNNDDWFFTNPKPNLNPNLTLWHHRYPIWNELLAEPSRTSTLAEVHLRLDFALKDDFRV